MAQKMISTVVIERQPLMQLRDYLTDDLSSCSSNGFKSFPRRRHCCTTVRFLLELDLTQKDHRPNGNHRGPDRGRVLKKSRSKTASATVSALQRASDAVINVVKSLRARLQGRPDGRLRLIVDGVAEERPRGPSDESTGGGSSGDKSKSTISWCESELGSSTSSGQSSDNSLMENDVVESQNDVSLGKVNKKVDTSTTVGEAIKEWSVNDEEKEQFSPVSVLDDPFKDDNHDDHTTSPNSYNKVPRFKGAKRKILLKIQRFKNIAHLKPVDLEKRIAMSEIEDKLSTLSVQKDDTNRNREERARELMKTIKSEGCCLGSKADNLMFDFFKERAMEHSKNNKVMSEKEALKVMEDWVNGETKEVFLGWEVKEGRKAYLKDMEKYGKWKKVDEEVEEIGLDLEARVWDSLVQELLLDIL